MWQKNFKFRINTNSLWRQKSALGLGMCIFGNYVRAELCVVTLQKYV
jgi:hypothetical protein